MRGMCNPRLLWLAGLMTILSLGGATVWRQLRPSKDSSPPELRRLAVPIAVPATQDVVLARRPFGELDGELARGRPFADWDVAFFLDDGLYSTAAQRSVASYLANGGATIYVLAWPDKGALRHRLSVDVSSCGEAVAIVVREGRQEVPLATVCCSEDRLDDFLRLSLIPRLSAYVGERAR